MVQMHNMLRLPDLSNWKALLRSNVKNICEGKNPRFYIYLIFSGSWIGPYIPGPILA
jgi:hypothetical protein